MTFTTEPMAKEYHAEPVDVGYQRGLIIKSRTTGAEVPNGPVFTADCSHQARITVDMMNLAHDAGMATGMGNTQPAPMTREQIDRVAAATMETGTYQLFMARIDAQVAAAREAPAPPAPCDADIHSGGTVVAVMYGGMVAMEGLVKEANRAAPGMDWHYFGGRALVKTLGDVAQARAALERAVPVFLNLTPAPAAADDYRVDAERWRAFIGSARVEPQGSTGLNDPMPNHYAHMGLEIWTTYDRDYSPALLEQMDSATALGRDWLTKYADIAVAALAAAKAGGDA